MSEMYQRIAHLREIEKYWWSCSYLEVFAGDCQYRAAFRCVDGITRPTQYGYGSSIEEATQEAYLAVMDWLNENRVGADVDGG